MAYGLINKERTLSIMPTFQCNAECSNCGTFSNPRVKTHLQEDLLLSAIDEAKSLGFFNVVFTGGEPTLRWGIVLEGISYAKSLGLHTRIVTNAYWAKSEIVAEKKLKKLMDAGLNEINFSTGDEHSEYIPINRIINACKASYKLGLDFHVNIEGTSRNAIKKEHFVNNILLSEIPKSVLDSRFEESPWMPLSPEETEEYNKDWYITEANLAACTGCSSVLQTIVVQGDGKIGACCGLGLNKIDELNVGQIGDITPIQSAIDIAENDLLILLLHYMGPEKILAWSSAKDSSIEWEGMYAHRCQACKRLYSDPKVANVLNKHIDELTPNLIASVAIDEGAWPKYASK